MQRVPQHIYYIHNCSISVCSGCNYSWNQKNILLMCKTCSIHVGMREPSKVNLSFCRYWFSLRGSESQKSMRSLNLSGTTLIRSGLTPYMGWAGGGA
jgi:hypothetical protein